MARVVKLAEAEVDQRRRLRRAMLSLCAVLVAVATLAIYFWPEAALVPTLSADDVTTLELELTATSNGQLGFQQTYDRREAFELLVRVLNTGREIADHRCPDTGHVVARLRDGSERHYGLLSGHDERYYHFRLYDGLTYRVFRVDRPAYIEVMSKLGVDRVDEAKPEL